MQLHLMAIDCCEHVLAMLADIRPAQLTTVASADRGTSSISRDIDLIVIGISSYPVRRLFVSQLRRVYPRVPLLILRRVESEQGIEDAIRGEFVLSEESGDKSDLEIVTAVRKILPMRSCVHVQKGIHYDKVREVLRVIFENYSNPDVDLHRVAEELSMAPAHLSRILNRQAGVSFRQLLKSTRIEEAKMLLASRKYSVKEVAARVGFSDSHYFSRTFKELTGQTATEYSSKDSIFG